jgi:hypothetical protein
MTPQLHPMTLPHANDPQTLPRTPAFAHVNAWIFDLDNTLYPASSRLFDQVDRRIGAFIAEHDMTGPRPYPMRFSRPSFGE